MTHVSDLINARLDELGLGGMIRESHRRIGGQDVCWLRAWELIVRGRTKRPKASILQAVSVGLGVPLDALEDAFYTDAGYRVVLHEGPVRVALATMDDLTPAEYEQVIAHAQERLDRLNSKGKDGKCDGSPGSGED